MNKKMDIPCHYFGIIAYVAFLAMNKALWTKHKGRSPQS